jgi:hypothetical protein
MPPIFLANFSHILPQQNIHIEDTRAVAPTILQAPPSIPTVNPSGENGKDIGMRALNGRRSDQRAEIHLATTGSTLAMRSSPGNSVR